MKHKNAVRIEFLSFPFGSTTDGLCMQPSKAARKVITFVRKYEKQT